MSELAQSELARLVVVDHLVASGWEQAASGALGELWRRGDAETVVPYSIEAGSAPWHRLAVALAQADREPTSDVLDQWATHFRNLRNAAMQGTATRAGGGRIEMEIHLDGPTVRNNEARAYEFGVLVMRTAESVKELVKFSRGTRHHSRELLVVGGPVKGSVRVKFTEPDYTDHDALFSDAPETSEGLAIAFLASMFDAADAATTSSESDVTDLRARLAPIGVRARQSVARLAEVVTDAGWSMTGVIRRGRDEFPIRLGLAGARLLSETSREGLEEQRTEVVVGTLDGWIWSRAELSLITEDRRSMRVAVPMPLQGQVASLLAQPDTRVSARIAVYVRVAQGTRDALHTAYSLISIYPLPAPDSTLLD